MSSEPATMEEARREIERLRNLAVANRESAHLQAMRAAAFETDARNRKKQVDIIRSSTSWRLTLPLRLAGRGPRWARRAVEIVASEGLGGISERIRVRLRERRQMRMRRAPPAQFDIYQAALADPAAAVVAPRVLILADLLLPQCAKYRVWQKQAHLALLGAECTVIDWRAFDRAWSALQTHALIIFYRVPGTPKALELIGEAKRLRLLTYWEADDLIFDMGHYLANRNLDTLEPRLRSAVLSGVELFRAAMLACDRTIASTAALAERMREAGGGPSLVIENALDAETLLAGDEARSHSRAPGDEVTIAYGSGSKAHDADFAEAAPALAAVLLERPQTGLRVIGDLKLPDALSRFQARIDHLPATDYRAYLRLLAAADISLAPLEGTTFNDAKSNIKFIEASILGLPSVCSPRVNFRDVVHDGETGFLAEGDARWQAALLRLVDDAKLRRRVGEAARRFVLDRYGPATVAHTQVAPLIAGLDQRIRPALRVLVVNIYFAPVTFGGATIVAEEMVRRLHARPDTDVFVFTSQHGGGQSYGLRRYQWEGVPVIGVQPPQADTVGEFDSPAAAAAFADVLLAVQPDVVHFHAVQMLGAGLLRACQDAGIPYVVTVHDAWWLCGRQFMVKEDGSYCFQTRIDLGICEACIPDAVHLRARFRMLMQALAGAALILSPSEAHRRLYLANGFDPARVLVNHNGIRLPDRPRRRPPGHKLRFGFVGGVSHLKGYHLIQQAFAAVADGSYELVLVDNALKLGFSSIDVAEWRLAGTLRVVPPYDQDGLDAFLDGIDVLLFPSQWKESFGLTVAEALARDVWVIVTEGGGAAEFVIDGENGTLIPLRNDPRPLQAAVEAVLADRERIVAHVNRYKCRLRDHAQQAEELLAMLRRAAETEVRAGKTPATPGTLPAAGLAAR